MFFYRLHTLYRNINLNVFARFFYPTALKGCWGIVFTHGVRMAGGRVFGGKKFVVGVQHHYVTLI